jgi:NADPH-dependent 2,4-dienoyl-CoA reductase/sulfur reductase-like enzyme
MKQVVIIGNGVSGITAARHIRKMSRYNITVISSETEHFFSRTALMYVYMGHLTFQNTKPYEDWFWKKNRIDLVFDRAEAIDIEKKLVHLKTGKTIRYDELILAPGSQSNFLGVAGEGLRGVQALYSYQDLQLMETNTQGIDHAVIVGGGLIGVEMAEMLCSKKIHVTVLVREPAFWNNVLPIQEATMISRHIKSHGVDLKHLKQLKEITGDENGNVTAISTTDGERIEADFVGITVGVHPNIDWLKNSGIAVNKGVLVNEYLETNIPGIFAIGDCVERLHPIEGRKKIEQVWYTARMMGEVVAQSICGDKTKYEPGPWFNSAKFFDIEYQTYGNVNDSLPNDQAEFYWEHPSGKKAVHVVWDKKTNTFLGINSFGIRLRHEKFDLWLREKREVNFVIDRLVEANFDPEFTERHEKEICELFLKETSHVQTTG